MKDLLARKCCKRIIKAKKKATAVSTVTKVSSAPVAKEEEGEEEGDIDEESEIICEDEHLRNVLLEFKRKHGPDAHAGMILVAGELDPITTSTSASASPGTHQEEREGKEEELTDKGKHCCDIEQQHRLRRGLMLWAHTTDSMALAFLSSKMKKPKVRCLITL